MSAARQIAPTPTPPPAEEPASRRKLLPRSFLFPLAAATALIGAAGVFAWHTERHALLTWHPGFTALHYNTAVLLTMAGASLAAGLARRRVAAAGLAAVVTACAVLIFCNELWALHWGLNNILFPVSRAHAAVATTRVAPNTALALLAAGLALIVLALPPARLPPAGLRRQVWQAAAICGLGSVAAVISLTSLAGYALAVTTAYRWRAYNPMSLPAAVAIGLLGAALVAAGLLRKPEESRAAGGGLSPHIVMLGISLTTASLLAWQALDWQRDTAHSGSLMPEVILALLIGISALAVAAVWLLQLARRRSADVQRSARAVVAERQRLRQVMDLMPAYVLLLARDYHVPFANRFFEQRFGPAEGRLCYQYLFRRDAPCVNCESFKPFTTQSPHQWEWAGPDGRTYEIHDFPFADHDGSALVMEVGLDVTEERAAEEKLQELNRSLRAISECNQLLIHAEEEQALLAGVCRVLVEHCGHQLAWVGYPEHDAAKSVRVVAAAGEASEYAWSAHTTWADEERGRGPTGTAIRTGQVMSIHDTETDSCFAPWRQNALQKGIHSCVSLPLDIGEEHPGALSIYSSKRGTFEPQELRLLEEMISDLGYGIRSLRTGQQRRQAEQALRESEQRYRSLTVATAQVVWMTDSQGLVRSPMPAWTEFTGRAAADLQGWGWMGDVHPDDRQRTEEVWKAATAARSFYETEYRLRRRDGKYREVWVRGVPVLDPGGAVREWVGTCTDITDRKLAEQQLERYARELERSNAELQDFASIASHDLQEPLRKVLAFGDRLREHCSEAFDDTGRDYLARMQNAAARMSQLIESLLQYSRVTSRAQPFQRVDLMQVAFEVVANLDESIRESGARIRCDLLPIVTADPTQMRQLLQNLVGNALKFRVPGRPPTVNVKLAPAGGGGYQLAVEDNGIGFDPVYLNRLFRPFQRLHGRQQYPGSGMGLAICRKIVERYHGTITASSRPGEGSVFLVTLPDGDAESEGVGGESEFPIADQSAIGNRQSEIGNLKGAN